MRIKVTVYYGEDDETLVRETEDYELPLQDSEPEAFEEALDHIGITFEAYLDDGHDLEDDDEESVGTDYLASWVLYEPFDDRREAKDFLDRLIEDCSVALSELE